PGAGCGRLALAVRPCVGLADRDRFLRHLLPLLPDAGAVARRRDGGRADGFPAGADSGPRRLAGLWRARRSPDRAGGRADPGRQPAEPEGGRPAAKLVAAGNPGQAAELDAFLGQGLGFLVAGLAVDAALVALAVVDFARLLGEALAD